MKRIGLLGGSFDPIHAGHLQLARDAIDQLALDELRLVVAAQPWQKPNITPARHRLCMVELALDSLDRALRERVRVEHCELERNGPSYTIDTLIELRRELGPDICLILVMGADQWRNLPTWHRHDELLEHASIAVAARPSLDAAATLPAGKLLSRTAGEAVSFAMTPHPASATAIRRMVAAGEPDKASALADLLPPAVLAYIRDNHLYTGPE